MIDNDVSTPHDGGDDTGGMKELESALDGATLGVALKEATIAPDPALVKELTDEVVAGIKKARETVKSWTGSAEWDAALRAASTEHVGLRARTNSRHAAFGRKGDKWRVFIYVEYERDRNRDYFELQIAHELVHHGQSMRGSDKSAGPEVDPHGRVIDWFSYYSNPKELMARAHVYAKQLLSVFDKEKALRNLRTKPPAVDFRPFLTPEALNRFYKYTYDYIQRMTESLDSDMDDLGDMKDFETTPDPEMDTLMDIVNKLHAAGLKVEKKGLENVKGPSIKPVSLGKGEGFKMIKKWENIYRRDDSVGMWAIIYPVGNHRNDSESDWRNYLESVIGAGKSSLDEMPGIQFFEKYAVIITVRIPGSKRVTEGLDADDDLGDMKDMAYAPVISRRGAMFRFIFAPDENDRPVPYKDMLIPYKVFYELGIMDYYTLRDAWENDEIRMSGEDAVMLYARDKSKFVNRHWDDDLKEIKLLPSEQQLLEAAEDDDGIGDMKEFDQPAYTDAEMDEMLATEVADKLRAAGLKFGDCKKLRNIRMGGLRDIVRLGKDAAFVLGNRMKVQTDGTALVSMWAVIRYSPEYCQYTDWALYINKIIGKENQVWVFNDNLVEITIPVGPSSQKFMAERLAVRIKSATPEGLKRLEGVYKEIFEQAKQMSSTLDKAPIQERYDVVVGSIGMDGVIRSEESMRSHTGAGVQRGKCWRYNPMTKVVYWCGDDSEHDVEDEGQVEKHLKERYGYDVLSQIALETIMGDDFGVAFNIAHGKPFSGESLIQEIAGCVNFWLDSKGNAFNAGSSHAEWAAKHLGIKLPNSAAEKDFWSVQGDIYRRMAKKGWLRVAILPGVSIMMDNTSRAVSGVQWDWVTAKAITGKLKIVDDQDDVIADYSVEESLNEPEDDIGDMKDLVGDDTRCIITSVSAFRQGWTTYLNGREFHYGAEHAQVFSNPQAAQRHIDALVRKGKLMPDSQEKLPLKIVPLEESMDDDDIGDMKELAGNYVGTDWDHGGFYIDSEGRTINLYSAEMSPGRYIRFRLIQQREDGEYSVSISDIGGTGHAGDYDLKSKTMEEATQEAKELARDVFVKLSESGIQESVDDDDIGDMKELAGVPSGYVARAASPITGVFTYLRGAGFVFGKAQAEVFTDQQAVQGAIDAMVRMGKLLPDSQAKLPIVIEPLEESQLMEGGVGPSLKEVDDVVAEVMARMQQASKEVIDEIGPNPGAWASDTEWAVKGRALYDAKISGIKPGSPVVLRPGAKKFFAGYSSKHSKIVFSGPSGFGWDYTGKGKAKESALLRYKLRTALAHELVHLEQHKRMPSDLESNRMSGQFTAWPAGFKFDDQKKHDHETLKAYGKASGEIMARARSFVQDMKDRGFDRNAMLKLLSSRKTWMEPNYGERPLMPWGAPDMFYRHTDDKSRNLYLKYAYQFIMELTESVNQSSIDLAVQCLLEDDFDDLGDMKDMDGLPVGQDWDFAGHSTNGNGLVVDHFIAHFSMTHQLELELFEDFVEPKDGSYRVTLRDVGGRGYMGTNRFKAETRDEAAIRAKAWANGVFDRLKESLQEPEDDIGDLKDFEGEPDPGYRVVGISTLNDIRSVVRTLDQNGWDKIYVARPGVEGDTWVFRFRVPEWKKDVDSRETVDHRALATMLSGVELNCRGTVRVWVDYDPVKGEYTAKVSRPLGESVEDDDLGDMKDMAGAPTPNFEVEGTANDKFVPSEAYKVMENGSWVDVIVGRMVWPPEQYRIQFDMLWAYRKEIADGNKSMEAWVEDKAREDVTAAVEKAFRGKVSVEIVRHTDKNWDYDFEAIIKVPKGYDMVEAVVVPDRQETDAIVDILVSGRKSTPEELNAKLAPYHIEVKNIPAFTEFPGAAGGVYGDMFYLNPKVLPYIGRDSLKTLVGHEMVHAGQMAKVAAAGADPHKITADLEDKMRKVGMEKFYATSPFELMALAKNAYDSMKERGVDVLVMLRKGSAAAFSPMRVSRSNDRFNKYVYQYAQQDKLVESVIAQLLEDDDIGDMKDMEGEPPFDPTNLGMRPVSTPAGPSGSTWTTGLIEAPNSGYSFALCLRYSAGTQRMLENTYVITVYIAPQFNSLVRLSGLSAEFIQDNMADIVRDFRAAVAGTGEPHTVTSAVRNAVKSKSPTGNVRFTESQDDDDIGDMKDFAGEPYKPEFVFKIEKAGGPGYMIFINFGEHYVGHMWVRTMGGAKAQVAAYQKQFPIMQRTLPFEPSKFGNDVWLWTVRAVGDMNMSFAEFYAAIADGTLTEGMDDDDIGDMKDLEGKAPLEDWQFKLSIPRDNPRSRLIKYVYKGKYAGGGFVNAGDSEASEKEAQEEIEHYKKDFIELEEIEPFDPVKYNNYLWGWYHANLNALKAKRGIIKESIVDDEVDMKDMENDHVTGYVEEEGDSSASAEPAPKKDATFNAAHWFDIATADQIGELAMEDYHFCKAADDVAFCISHDDENLDRFFGQVKGGYLTTINKSEAEAYIQAHRPEVWERVQEMVEAHTRMFGPVEAPVAA